LAKAKQLNLPYHALKKSSSVKGKVMMRPNSTAPRPNLSSPRRRLGFGKLVLFGFVMIGIVAVLLLGLFRPAQLAIVQEQVLALLHGGVASREEQRYIEACVATPDGFQASERTIRTVHYKDGTWLSVSFAARPSKTTASCE
jgi:hypothetical protein